MLLKNIINSFIARSPKKITANTVRNYRRYNKNTSPEKITNDFLDNIIESIEDSTLDCDYIVKKVPFETNLNKIIEELKNRGFRVYIFKYTYHFPTVTLLLVDWQDLSEFKNSENYEDIKTSDSAIQS